MNTHATNTHTRSDGIGLPGQTVIALTLAGAVGMGGFLVAIMTLMEKLSGGGLMLSSTGFFLIGSFIGGLHGLVLGYIGREPGSDKRRTLISEARSLLYAMPALAVAWPFTTWIAMTIMSRYTGQTEPIVLSALSWAAGILLLLWAASVTWRAARNAYARWPERETGRILVPLTFVALGAILLNGNPELWGTQLRLTPVGAVLIAAAASLWIVGPMLTLGLRSAHRMNVGLPAWRAATGRGSGKGSGRDLNLTNTAIGIACGLVVALIALPFYRDPIGLPSVWQGSTVGLAVMLLASRALLDEALLRVGLTSTILWLAWRYHLGSRNTASVLAVVGAAVVQVLVYAPGAIAYGLRSDWTTVAYLGAAVLIPALIFGTLYVRRGLGAAVVADGSAIAVVGLLAAL